MSGVLQDALSLLFEDVYKVKELGMSHTLCLPANLLNLSNLWITLVTCNRLKSYTETESSLGESDHHLSNLQAELVTLHKINQDFSQLLHQHTQQKTLQILTSITVTIHKRHHAFSHSH